MKSSRIRSRYYPLRSTVRPGVTGWAQVRYGHANDLEEETEKMRCTTSYLHQEPVDLARRSDPASDGPHRDLLGQGATEVKRRTRHTGTTWSTVRAANHAGCLRSRSRQLQHRTPSASGRH